MVAQGDRLEVVGFEPKYVTAFFELNREWIERYFRMEPMDYAQMQDPKSTIVDAGGEIFFAISSTVDGGDGADEKAGKALGTVAMIPHGPGEYELAKMAVAMEARGRGIGDLLMKAAMQWAIEEKGARAITILSNTRLAPAISLYKKHGFEVLEVEEGEDRGDGGGKSPISEVYNRANIKMRYTAERN